MSVSGLEEESRENDSSNTPVDEESERDYLEEREELTEERILDMLENRCYKELKQERRRDERDQTSSGK